MAVGDATRQTRPARALDQLLACTGQPKSWTRVGLAATQCCCPAIDPAVVHPRLFHPHNLLTQVLVEKCLGRRLCRKCGKNYNVADIYLPASNGRPEIVMPPLNPPAECMQARGPICRAWELRDRCW